ncbi:uncharacterized protein A4U43_C03F11200 [Asparagus officinalis]|uniref:Dolichyl-diphosphooligosaccharide--protein glycosyltransferase 48 kDa subunit n=1 Tax=Asparagus officinalis TaxID=4686 RepID=A0A5P1FAX4_ASPOF|nr:uncharacterized protein A4U43_C03F11200 [Asparagus officinalis]
MERMAGMIEVGDEVPVGGGYDFVADEEEGYVRGREEGEHIGLDLGGDTRGGGEGGDSAVGGGDGDRDPGADEGADEVRVAVKELDVVDEGARLEEVMAKLHALVALLFLLPLLSSSFNIDSPTDRRILVLVDDLALQSSHSIFFNSLRSGGFDLDFKLADDPKLALQRYGQYLYDALILFAPSITSNSLFLSVSKNEKS